MPIAVSSPDWTKTEDKALIAACLEGDEAAWECLIARYRSLIYVIPVRFGLPQPLAEEVFQETCLRLLEKLSTLRNSDKLGSWLMTTTRRICIEHFRRQSKAEGVLPETMIDEAAEEALEEALHAGHQHMLVQDGLAKLSERDRGLIYALYFRQPPATYAEISAEFDIAIGSIGPTRARALARLRKLIQQVTSAQSVL